MYKKIALLLFIAVIASLSGFSQDKISAQIHAYGKKSPSSSLFVHYDKNIYSNNESVWFTAYGLDSRDRDSIASIFIVALLRNIDSTVIVQNKFIYQDGFAFGNFTIPDTLITGDYSLIAFTNKFVNGHPMSPFIQPITIKTTRALPINLSVKNLTDSAELPKAKILVSATSKNNSFLTKPATVFYTYNGKTIKKTTDPTGQLMFDVPLDADNKNPNLDVNVKFGNDNGFVRLPLKIKPRKASVKFYPEGGTMINNVPFTVGFEVKDIYDSPIETYAVLYKNNRPIDTVRTAAYGIGTLQLKPEKGDSYSLKLLHSEVVDSTFRLPDAIDDGVSITINEAVSKDTLRMVLQTNSPRKVYLRVHNFKETFALAELQIRKTQPVVIPLVDMPHGLATVIVTDSAGRPFAERVVFLHYANEKQMIINTDTTVYGIRKSVELTIKLTDTLASGVVSIACVQDNRIDLNKLTDIRQYAFLESALEHIPTPPSVNKLTDHTYLEDILLVKGWTRYKWQDVLQHSKEDSLQKITRLALTGSVTKNKNTLKESINVNIMTGAAFATVKTNPDGSFTPNIADLTHASEKKILIITDNADKNLYKIALNDPFIAAAKTLRYYASIFGTNSDLRENRVLIIPKNEQSLQIDAVDILSKKNNDDLYGQGPNPCGDWVCRYNFLNCFTHNAYFPGSKKPQEGQIYNIGTGQEYTKSAYWHCTYTAGASNLFDGINLAKEFYKTDQVDPTEPAFFSTLFWAHSVVLGVNKDATIRFNTGDITGKFRIIVQGISNKEPISGQVFFEVKAKQ